MEAKHLLVTCHINTFKLTKRIAISSNNGYMYPPLPLHQQSVAKWWYLYPKQLSTAGVSSPLYYIASSWNKYLTKNSLLRSTPFNFQAVYTVRLNSNRNTKLGSSSNVLEMCIFDRPCPRCVCMIQGFFFTFLRSKLKKVALKDLKFIFCVFSDS